MENSNQRATMYAHPESFGTDTSDPVPIPESGSGLNGDDNGDPTGTPGIPDAPSTSAPSESPNMEPDDDSGDHVVESVGSDDGTEISPVSTDEEFLK